MAFQFKPFSRIILREQKDGDSAEAAVMWDNQKRTRFEELREPGRQLNAVEQTELAALVKELEDVEAAYLKPATERLRRENDCAQKRNLELAALLKRKEALVERLENVLAEAEAEERAIATELAAIGAGSPTPSVSD
jgi:hypothetical protein